MDYFSLDIKLKKYNEYKSVNCYHSYEEIQGEPFIKGLYLKKRENLGTLPEEINLRFSFYADKILNRKFMVNKYNELNTITHEILFVSKNKFNLNTIINYEKLMDGKVYRLFRGMLINNKNYVKEVYIHKEYLTDNYPTQILISMNWNYSNKTDETKLF